MRRKIPLALVASALSMTLLSCSSAGSEDTDSSGARDVTVQLYNPPTTFSPLIPAVGGNQLIQSLHWDSLLGVDDSGEYEPRLAESWEVSKDGTVWTFKLREGLTWSDGEPFTAADVVFSYNLYANPATGSALAGRLTTVEGVDQLTAGSTEVATGFKATDDTTFTVTLTQPNTAKLIDLAEPQFFVLPKHVYGDKPVEGLAEDASFREPKVGIGPYLFSRWMGDDQVEFAPNPEYRAELGLDHVYARFVDTDVAQAQLQTGEIDFAQVAAAEADRVKGLEGVSFHEVGGAGIMALHNAYDSGKLADPRVRQAIMYAIDRQAIVDKVIGGYGEVVNTVIHGPEWAVPDGLTQYERDVDKAKDLLADAGWDPTTQVRLEIVPGPKDREKALTIIAGQLQEVGINAVVQQYDNAGQAEAIANRDFDLLISGYGVFNVDPAAMNAILMCDNGALSGYCDPALDEMLQAGVRETEQEGRAKIYAEAQQIVNEELPIFPLYVPDTLAATTDRLQGFKLNPLPTNAFWNAAEWTVG